MYADFKIPPIVPNLFVPELFVSSVVLMVKRKRSQQVKPSYTAGPLDEHTGQRSVFPELVTQSKRDSEWGYDEEEADDQDDGGYEEGNDDLTGQTFNLNDLDFAEDMEEEVGEELEEEESMEEDMEDDEWEVEPQTDVLAYLHSVRAEAETLPSLSYVSQEAVLINGIDIKDVDSSLSNRVHEDAWRQQFLGYYKDLRTTIAEAPEPILSQDELDKLLHINPNRRPETSAQEDGLWRLKTLDQPSIALLSMLDHQRTIHLLTHLRKKMSAHVKAEQCMWLVFLLARLGDPGVLGGEEIDLLRRIGKKCIMVRDGLKEDGKETVLSTVDMVVCIIKHFYQQMDLEEIV